MTLDHRPYAGEADYQRMRAFLSEVYALERTHYCSIGDLDWWRSAEPDPDALDAELWFEGGRLVGFAWPSDAMVDMIAVPGRADIDGAMLEWSEGRQRSIGVTGDAPPSLTAWAYTGDATRVSLFESRGYRRGEGILINLRGRSIEGPIQDYSIPDGYQIRSLRGPEEMAQRVEVHRDAFAPSKMTATRYTAVMAQPSYRLDLDIVAEAPDGSLAAFTIVWFDAENSMGVFEPVGCHSAHRRRGLASAVIIEGMRRLQWLGATTAHVSSAVGADAENLYESLGFRVIDRFERWVRELV